MEKRLHNLALFMLTDFCIEQGIDCSNTYVVKDGRGFTYSLRDGATGAKRAANITFHASNRPTFQIITVEAV